MKKRIVIYDFDNTIFHSPTKEEAERKNPVLFKGWYVHQDSLNPPHVPHKPSSDWFVSETVEAYRRDSKDEDTEVILMTGRLIKFKKRIIEICDKENLYFDRYFFKLKYDETFKVKKSIILNQIIHPKLEHLEIWEDRAEHAERFKELFSQIKSDFSHIQTAKVHKV